MKQKISKIIKFRLQGSMCCSYGIAGTSGYDCVMIPGASNGLVPILMKANTYCGRSMGLGITAMTVCSKSFFSFSVFVLFFFVSFFISVFIYFTFLNNKGRNRNSKVFMIRRSNYFASFQEIKILSVTKLQNWSGDRKCKRGLG